MNTDLVSRYQRLKEEIDRLDREKAQVEGRLAQSLTEIEKEFGCRTLVEAKKLLAKLRYEADDLERRFGQQVDEFKQKWVDVLTG